MSTCRNCVRYKYCELPSRDVCNPAEDCKKFRAVPPIERVYLGKWVRFMTDEETDALNRLTAMMNTGYIDINNTYDSVEFDLIARALSEYKFNHTGETKKGEET